MFRKICVAHMPFFKYMTLTNAWMNERNGSRKMAYKSIIQSRIHPREEWFTWKEFGGKEMLNEYFNWMWKKNERPHVLVFKPKQVEKYFCHVILGICPFRIPLSSNTRKPQTNEHKQRRRKEIQRKCEGVRYEWVERNKGRIMTAMARKFFFCSMCNHLEIWKRHYLSFRINGRWTS
jgi:hypothetical protein